MVYESLHFINMHTLKGAIRTHSKRKSTRRYQSIDNCRFDILQSVRQEENFPFFFSKKKRHIYYVENNRMQKFYFFNKKRYYLSSP